MKRLISSKKKCKHFFTSVEEPVSTSGRAPLTSDQEEAIKDVMLSVNQLMVLNKWAKGK